MDYQMLAKNLFNDMYIFLNGTQPLPLEAMADAYQDEPLFLALVGGLDQAGKIDYNAAMKECYQFYKTYCGRELMPEEWEQVVVDVGTYTVKWENEWCKGLILALLDLLEKEEKIWRKNGEEADVRGDESQGEPEQEDGQEQISAAA